MNERKNTIKKNINRNTWHQLFSAKSAENTQNTQTEYMFCGWILFAARVFFSGYLVLDYGLRTNARSPFCNYFHYQTYQMAVKMNEIYSECMARFVWCVKTCEKQMIAGRLVVWDGVSRWQKNTWKITANQAMKKTQTIKPHNTHTHTHINSYTRKWKD